MSPVTVSSTGFPCPSNWWSLGASLPALNFPMESSGFCRKHTLTFVFTSSIDITHVAEASLPPPVPGTLSSSCPCCRGGFGKGHSGWLQSAFCLGPAMCSCMRLSGAGLFLSPSPTAPPPGSSMFCRQLVSGSFKSPCLCDFLGHHSPLAQKHL